MKIVRIRTDEGIVYGAAGAEGVTVYKGSPLVAWEETEVLIPYKDVQLLAPVLPTKVVAVGRNYAAHAAELGNSIPESPMLFLKPSTSVIGPDVAIKLPKASSVVHHEAELAVVIGTLAKDVKAEDADRVILGYTAANDVSARDLQKADGQWGRAKGFDTFCPLGPAIETELDPTEGLAVISRVNGVVRQSGSTADLIFGVPELIEFISGVMTLLPGDVILTGTPEGVGPIVDGDRVEIEIERIGVLENPVVAR